MVQSLPDVDIVRAEAVRLPFAMSSAKAKAAARLDSRIGNQLRELVAELQRISDPPDVAAAYQYDRVMADIRRLMNEGKSLKQRYIVPYPYSLHYENLMNWGRALLKDWAKAKRYSHMLIQAEHHEYMASRQASEQRKPKYMTQQRAPVFAETPDASWREANVTPNMYYPAW